jgi:protein O-GlcNAc transferase
MTDQTNGRVVAIETAIQEAAEHLHARRFGLAAEYYEAVLRVRPHDAILHHQHGLALDNLHRANDAAAAYRRAIALKPDFAPSYNNLANLLTDQNEALAMYRRAIELEPNARIHSNLIWRMGTLSGISLAEIHAEWQRWYRARRATAPANYPDWPNEPDMARKLRLGFVSADFFEHSQSLAFGPVMSAHDRSKFEVVCYSATVREDNRTAELRSYADRWRIIRDLPDDVVARMVREDGIDILIDLSGHTPGNRLPVFMRKPAPVQVTASAHGTGIPEIDYLFSDIVHIPLHERRFFVEQIVDLPSVLFFGPPTDAPEIGPLPALTRGSITFGCLNRFSKVTDHALTVWARILHRLPQSRLLLKDRVFSEPKQCQSALDRLARLDISPGRVALLGATRHRDHLGTYNDVDLALDPFPENGGITTCEALWMGAPVVVQHSTILHGRVGASILAALGLTNLVAHDDDDYVERALRLAADVENLGALRAGLRARMRESPVANVLTYVRAVEDAYRMMWGRWCYARSVNAR